MKTKETITVNVSAKYKKGTGIKFKVGTFFVALGTRIMKTKVRVYANSEKIGELSSK